MDQQSPPRRWYQFHLRHLFVLMTLAAAIFTLVRAHIHIQPISKYRLGYRRGAAEADLEWRNGCPTIYVWGFVGGIGKPDLITGLPFKFVGRAGDLGLIGRVEGHNKRSLEHLEKRGLSAEALGEARGAYLLGTDVVHFEQMKD